MARRDIVLIGGSAGALEALLKLAAGLPADLAAALFVVVHTSTEGEGLLAQILRRAGPLSAYAVDGRDVIRHGRIYVAPPDRHLLIQRGFVQISGGPKENGFRPAVDPLFRTAAAAYGARVIGVILSGGLDDGTRGLLTIKRAGGLAVVQKPDDALIAGMPQSAIDHVRVDHAVPAAELGGLLARLVREEIPQEVAAMSQKKGRSKPDIALEGAHGRQDGSMPGPPSSFVCPECGGALWEIRDGRLISYRCHVGHAYSADGLVTRHGEKLDAALWTALRTLEDNAGLRRHMAENMLERGLPEFAAKYEDQAAQLEERAEVIRSVVILAEPQPPTAEADEASRHGAGAGVGRTNGNGSGSGSSA